MAKNEGKSDRKYLKQQFLLSKGFSTEKKYILETVLQDKNKYTREQAETEIKNFLNREVK